MIKEFMIWSKAAFCYKEIFGEELPESLRISFESPAVSDKYNRDGYYSVKDGIVLRKGMNPCRETAALCHELTHYWALQQQYWISKKVRKWLKEGKIQNIEKVIEEWSNEDGSKLFETMLKNKGLPSNYNHDYVNWRRIARLQKMYEVKLNISARGLQKQLFGL